MAYLLWDVTLAAVPLAPALAVLDRRGAPRPARLAVGACWLQWRAQIARKLRMSIRQPQWYGRKPLWRSASSSSTRS